MDIEKFVQEANVSSIYWVDDEHVSQENIDIDTLASAVLASVQADDGAINDELKRDLIKLHPELKRQIRRFFNNDGAIEDLFSDDDAKEILEIAIQRFEGIPKEQLITVIDDYLSSCSTEYSRMSFTDWNQAKDHILAKLNTENRALILLDLKNTKESGLSNAPGVDVITNLSAHDNKDCTYVIIFTSDVSIDEEIHRSRELTNAHYAQSDLPLFMLSKRREITKAESYLGTALKRILLTASYIDLKEKLIQIYHESVNTTFSELKTMTAEEMIFKLARGSEKEGIPVLESILRVISSVTDFSLQNQIATDKDLTLLIRKCLSLDSEIERCKNIQDTFILNFQKNEKYENIHAINVMFSPISVGDIFKFKTTKGTCEYILLGNFCFTALRANGARKNIRASLFPLTTQKPEHENQFQLEMYDIEGISNFFIDFCRPDSIDYTFLDLCWLDSEGRADLSITGVELFLRQQQLPLIKAQRYRVIDIRNKFRKSGFSYIRNGEGDQIIEISRSGRLSREHSLLALHKYTRQLNYLPDELGFN